MSRAISPLRAVRQATKCHPGRSHPLFGRAVSGQVAHGQRQVVGHHRRQLPLGQIEFPTQGCLPHPALVDDVGEAAFDVLAAFAQQRLAACALYRAAGFHEHLFDRAVLLVLAPFFGMRIADDDADAFALETADCLNREVSFVRREALKHFGLFGIVAGA